MSTMLVQFQVRDFASWRKVFDSVSEVRKSRGMLSGQVFHDAADPNKVVLLIKWDTLENAKKWNQSPELKAGQEKAGVILPVDTRFLTEM